MHPSVGQKIDRFVLVKPLGSGGQASVWLADDLLQPGTQRALKIVPLRGASETKIDRIRDEARTLAKLSHPGLVACHGFFESFENQVAVVILELVQGMSLAEALDSEQVSVYARYQVLIQLLHALAVLHEAGLVHRDVKAENILLSRSFLDGNFALGGVKLVDLGIAVEIGNPSARTSTGLVIGTLPCMAPEILDPSHFQGSMAPALDVYAWGVLAWQLLVGQHPTGLPAHAPAADYVIAHRAERPAVLPPVVSDPAWRTAMERAVQVHPARRPVSATAVLQLLGTASGSTEPQGKPSNTPQAPNVTEPTPAGWQPTHQASAPHHSVFFPPSKGNEPEREPPKPSPRSGFWWVGIAISICIIGLFTTVIVFALVSATGGTKHIKPPRSDAGVPPKVAAPTATPPPTGTPSPRPIATPIPTPIPSLSGEPPQPTEPACCGGESCACSAENTSYPGMQSICVHGEAFCKRCPSGREKVNGPCGESLDPQKAYYLRLVSAKIGTRSLRDVYPNGLVCLQHEGKGDHPHCFGLNDVWIVDSRNVATNVADLEKGLEVMVSKTRKYADKVLTLPQKPKKLHNDALCLGAKLVFRNPDSESVQLTFYLEEQKVVSEAAKQSVRCAGQECQGVCCHNFKGDQCKKSGAECDHATNGESSWYECDEPKDCSAAGKVCCSVHEDRWHGTLCLPSAECKGTDNTRYGIERRRVVCTSAADCAGSACKTIESIKVCE